MLTYSGSSSLWDVLPTITGQYFDSRRADAPRPQPVPPAPGDAWQRQLASLLPLVLLVGVALFAYRALK